MGDRMCQCGHYESDHGADGSCDSSASTGYCPCFIFDDSDAQPDPRDAKIARLKAEMERVTEVARLLVGECEEQRECPVCGTDTNVEVCRPSCYVAKMRKVLDGGKGCG